MSDVYTRMIHWSAEVFKKFRAVVSISLGTI